MGRAHVPALRSPKGGTATLLTIDVGNSETKVGVFDGDRLIRTWRLQTDRRRTVDEFGVHFTQLFAAARFDRAAVDAVVIGSVVPQLDSTLREVCVAYVEREPLVLTAVGQQLIEVRTERPQEVGADLIAGAIGAKSCYGAPAIVVQFGTATTFTAIGRDGAFVGTAIAPGILISIDALVSRTAKLPQVALVAPERSIGRETVASLQAGIIFGFVGQTEALVTRFRAELGAAATVVATGGLAETIAQHTPAIDATDPFLNLKGLRRFHESRVGVPNGASQRLRL